jgi:hypothetical protein
VSSNRVTGWSVLQRMELSRCLCRSNTRPVQQEVAQLTPEIKLEWFELMMAANVGVTRRVVSLKNGLKSRLADSEPNFWAYEIEGAVAELVVAKVTNRYWDGSVNRFKADGDIGKLIQVRHTREHHNRLIVRPDDADDKPYVLVTGFNLVYRVPGWILGRDAKRPEWREAPVNRAPAYWVKPQDLRPIDTLNEFIVEKEENG